MTTPLLQQIEKLSAAMTRENVAQAARDMASYDLKELLVKRLPQITQALRMQHIANGVVNNYRAIMNGTNALDVSVAQSHLAMSIEHMDQALQSSPEGGG